MASTSTNKQPCLIDRPLHRGVILGNVAALTTAADLNTPTGAGLKLLAEGGTDGALIDAASVLALQASLTTSMVLLFMSSSATAAGVTPENTWFVAGVAIPGSVAKGARTNIPLPPLSVPVPNLAKSGTETTGWPGETDKKNTGLFIEKERYLYAGLDAVLSAPSATARVVVSVQGGFY